MQPIEVDLLVTVIGGVGETPAQAPQQQEGPPQRTWGQLGREYLGACVQGAGQAMVFGGRPRSVRDGATTAAIGCAMGVGMRGVEDLTRMVTGGE